MFDLVTEYIDNNWVLNKKIPYFDVAVNRGYKNVYRYYGGRVCADGKEKLCMFSLTKPLTAVLMLRLIEDGKASLDDDVADYIPAFKSAYYFAGGEKMKADIKIRHLLTMTSGLNYDLKSQSINEVKILLGNKATTFDIVSAYSHEPLEFKPGERFLYSLSFDVLAAIIERISGARFSDYIDRVIFKPLGMNNSSVKSCNNVPDVFIFDEKSGIRKTDNNAYYDFIFTDEYESGGAGLISSVEDYLQFAETLANGGVAKNGYRLLTQKSLDLMAENHISNISFGNSFTCVQGTDYGYGFGVRTRTKESAGGVPVGEFGWDGAAGSYLLVDPKNCVSVVIGLNVLNWPSFFKGEHLKIIEKIYSELHI